jgi:predicted metal-dependent phosphoesterase TrpH
MSNAKSELFVYLGAAFATLIGLAVLQKWYGTYIDLRYHAELAAAGPAEGMLAARQDDQAALQKGKIPLDQAISRLAQRGRGSINSIAPAPSADLSAISGWIHQPGFKPAVAHPIRTPRAPVAEVAQPAAAAAAAPSTAQAPATPAAPAAPAAPTGR